MAGKSILYRENEESCSGGSWRRDSCQYKNAETGEGKIFGILTERYPLLKARDTKGGVGYDFIGVD